MFKLSPPTRSIIGGELNKVDLTAQRNGAPFEALAQSTIE